MMCRKLQIVVKISVNFWQCFSLADVVVTFATLWWPFAVAFAVPFSLSLSLLVFLTRFVSFVIADKNLLKRNDRERERRKTEENEAEQNFVIFRVRKVCSNPPSSPLLSILPPPPLPQLNSFIFVANFWHFSWTTFSSSSSSAPPSCCEGKKYFFEILFHISFFFCFSRLFSVVFFISMFFLCAGHAFSYSIFFLYVCLSCMCSSIRFGPAIKFAIGR